ncbi:S8 family serine peptidase [Flavobacterium sp. RHBU_3]|uniref:S8 family serine peptidase n=1 Tax=Flavobacterium sp. RHBU_3 TaxID=3391184 RepID=UPI003985298D
MRKNTLRVVLVFGFACFGAVAYGQRINPARQAINDSLAKVLYNRSALEKEKAIQMAAEKGWPLKIEKDGSFSELMRVLPSGDPFYYKTANVGSAITSRANLLYASANMGFDLDGTLMLAGVWDQDMARSTHVTFGGRLTVKDSGASDYSEHNTHVSGTMIGSGSGNSQARGLAYGASIWDYNWTSDIAEMSTSGAYLCVSNHSYGIDASQLNGSVYIFGRYDGDAHDVDQVTFNNPYYQPVVAAGNDRNSGINPDKGGNDLLSGMGVGKNAITVAAIYQVDDYTGPSSVQIAGFSNYGPTDDMRIKPDIASKGVNVLSSLSTSNTAYGTLSGTSMASPGISGVIILLQQLYSNLHPSDDIDIVNLMRSASVRGLLAHTADEAGPNDGPDHMTGWGLVNAYKAALVIQNEGLTTEKFEENSLANGDQYVFDVTSDGVNPLEVTISWTDRPATANNSSSNVDALLNNATELLVNDLDVRVENLETGEVYYPWKLTGTLTNPTVTTGDNKVDNIEKIQIPNAGVGNYTVTVSHKASLYNSIAQDYTLIVTGIGGTQGVKDFMQNNVAVWPNPADNVVNVSLATGEFGANASMAIFDIQGREVLRKAISSNAASADVSQLTTGVYFVKIFSGGSEFVKKIIVK